MSANPLYRALNAEETRRIKKGEEVYLGSAELIEEITKGGEIPKRIYRMADKHIRLGNIYKNEDVSSVTGSFGTAIDFATPSVVIKGNKVVHVKINRSPIAVFSETYLQQCKQILNILQKNSGVGAMAKNFTKAPNEMIITGRIDESNFYILEKLHQDLLFCCYDKRERLGHKGDFIKLLNKIIYPEKQKEIHKFCVEKLTSIEKLIYHLIYRENLNLYEVAAPVYYSNKSANIYCIYDALFEILLSILTKIYDYLEVTIPDNVSIKNELLKVYKTELNVLCLGGNYDWPDVHIDYIKLIEFNALFDEYNNIEPTEFGDSDYIWKIKLDPIKYNDGKIGCDINTSPIFLYLPKSLPKELNNKIKKFDDYLLSKRFRDIHFQEYSSLTCNRDNPIFGNTKYKRPEEGYSCEIKVGRAGNILNKEKKQSDYSYSIFFNLSILYSELYIPPYYTSIESTFFSLKYMGKDCFDFYNSYEGTKKMTLHQYNEKRERYFFGTEYIQGHKEKLHSYADRLVKVFGGRNLESVDYKKYLEERPHYLRVNVD